MSTETPMTDSAAQWARVVDQQDTDPPHEQMVGIDFARKLEVALRKIAAEKANIRPGRIAFDLCEIAEEALEEKQ